MIVVYICGMFIFVGFDIFNYRIGNKYTNTQIQRARLAGKQTHTLLVCPRLPWQPGKPTRRPPLATGARGRKVNRSRWEVLEEDPTQGGTGPRGNTITHTLHTHTHTHTHTRTQNNTHTHTHSHAK